MEVQENIADIEGASEMNETTEVTFGKVEKNKINNEVTPSNAKCEAITHDNTVSTDNTQNVEEKQIKHVKVSQDIPNSNTKCEEITHDNTVSTDKTQDVEEKHIEHVKVSQDISNSNAKCEEIKHDTTVSTDKTQDVEEKQIEHVKVSQDIPNSTAKCEEIKHDNTVSTDDTQDVEEKQIEHVKVSQDIPNKKTIDLSLDHSENAVNDVNLSQKETEPNETELGKVNVSQNKQETIVHEHEQPEKMEPIKDTQIKHIETKISEDVELSQIKDNTMIQDSEDMKNTEIKKALSLKNLEDKTKTISTMEVTQHIKVSEKEAISANNAKLSQDNLEHSEECQVTTTSKNSPVNKNIPTEEETLHKESENTPTTTKKSEKQLENNNDSEFEVLQKELLQMCHQRRSELLASEYNEDDLVDYNEGEDLDQAMDDILYGIDLDEGEAAGDPQTSYKQPETKTKVEKIQTQRPSSASPSKVTAQVENKLQGPTPVVQEPVIKCLCPTLRIRFYPRQDKAKAREIRLFLSSLLGKHIVFWLHMVQKPVVVPATGRNYVFDGCLLEFTSKEQMNLAFNKLKDQFFGEYKITVLYFSRKWRLEVIKHGGPAYNFECNNATLTEKVLKRASVDPPSGSAAKQFKADTNVAHTETLPNNEATTRDTIGPELDNPFRGPGVFLRQPFDKRVRKNYETYGLSIRFLENLRIRPPLTHIVRVTQVNPQVNSEHKRELKEIFSLAGGVTNIFFRKRNGIFCWLVHYKHPLEAVQAVSLFHDQKICGYTVCVRIVPYTGLSLPPGLESIGPGLGPNRLPLPYIALKFEVRNLKQAIRAQGQVNINTGDTEEISEDILELEDESPQSSNQPIALLSSLMTQLNQQTLSKDTAQSLKDQFLTLAQIVALKADQNTQGDQNQIRRQQKPPFNRNQLPSSSGLQNQFAAPKSTAMATYNPYQNQQNQVNPGLEWSTNTQTNSGVSPSVPFADPQVAMYNQALVQQQYAAIQQYQLNSAASQQQVLTTQQQINVNPATPAAQPMMYPQWALQQTNLNVVSQQSLNPAPAQQQNPNPALTQQQNLKPTVPTQRKDLTSHQILQLHKQQKQGFPQTFVPQKTAEPQQATISSSKKKYSAEPVPYKNQQQNIQKHGPTKRQASERVQTLSHTINFSNLPPSVTCQALLTKMKGVGDVMSCEMIGKGRAMVRFKHVGHAAKCFKLFHRSKVDGQVIELKFNY